MSCELATFDTVDLLPDAAPGICAPLGCEALGFGDPGGCVAIHAKMEAQERRGEGGAAVKTAFKLAPSLGLWTGLAPVCHDVSCQC